MGGVGSVQGGGGGLNSKESMPIRLQISASKFSKKKTVFCAKMTVFGQICKFRTNLDKFDVLKPILTQSLGAL